MAKFNKNKLNDAWIEFFDFTEMKLGLEGFDYSKSERLFATVKSLIVDLKEFNTIYDYKYIDECIKNIDIYLHSKGEKSNKESTVIYMRYAFWTSVEAC